MFFSIEILFLIFISIYGWSWTITKSSIFNEFKKHMHMYLYTLKIHLFKKILSKILYLLNCIVCVSFWIACLYIIIIHIIYPNIYINFFQILIFLGTQITFTWILASILNDAD